MSSTGVRTVLEIVIAIVGACIAVGSAVINGISARRIAVEKERLSSTSAALTVIRNERTAFSISQLNPEHALTIRLSSYTYSRKLKGGYARRSRNTLCDALVFGHRAATSADPNDDATREYERRAHSIVNWREA